ncbi:hypothetical protein BDV95DRAFT_564879, partial [Massariosphaeria phaeospora]
MQWPEFHLLLLLLLLPVFPISSCQVGLGWVLLGLGQYGMNFFSVSSSVSEQIKSAMWTHGGRHMATFPFTFFMD